MDKRKIVEYLDLQGNSPFAKWFIRLDPQAAARITTALYRLEQGNFSNTKSVGKGVSEYKIDFGPGYRVYYSIDGQTIILLLNGGIKKRQQRDIEIAWKYWADYKKRKRKI